jgi:hypothetical protein
MTNETEEKKGIFETLYGINVGAHLEKKGKLDYLKWSSAFRILLQHYPKSTWRVLKQEEIVTGVDDAKIKGFVVGTEVTVVGDNETVTRTEILPIINYSNKIIDDPSTMDINTAIKRCYVKTIAHLGLGLGVYEGADYPEDCADPEVNGKANKPKPTGIAKVDQVLDDIPIGDDEPVTPNRSTLIDTFNSWPTTKQKAKLKFYKDKHATMHDVVDIFDISEEQAKELLIEESIGHA